MTNPATMSKEEKYRYIFKDQSFENHTRFGWITDCLLGDIQTFQDGIKNKDKSAKDGGGNLSVPILINTALEFIAELYEGNTDNILCFSIDMSDELKKEWKEFKIDCLSNRLKEIIESKGYDNLKTDTIASISKSKIEIDKYQIKKEGATKLNVYKKYNATNNVINFIQKYFPDEYKNIPNILWSGTRNGLVHTFYPTFFEYQGNCIRFQFYVGDQDIQFDVTLKRNAGPTQTSGDVRTVSFNVSSSERIDYNSKTQSKTVIIRINVSNLYKVLKEAIEKYRADLEEDDKLQEKFIKAWKSIENNKQPINRFDKKADEFKGLLSKLKKSNNHLLLQ